MKTICPKSTVLCCPFGFECNRKLTVIVNDLYHSFCNCNIKQVKELLSGANWCYTDCEGLWRLHCLIIIDSDSVTGCVFQEGECTSQWNHNWYIVSVLCGKFSLRSMLISEFIHHIGSLCPKLKPNA